jgi:beta-phosphoglucomutase-like phosphatase (HAD superfamily)
MPAFLFDLEGTLVDSVYQHVLAWREASEKTGIELAVWRIHRRIGMSGGLLVNALLRETGRQITTQEAKRLQQAHAEAYAGMAAQIGPLPGACQLLAHLTKARTPWAIATSVRLETARQPCNSSATDRKSPSSRAIRYATPNPIQICFLPSPRG